MIQYRQSIPMDTHLTRLRLIWNGFKLSSKTIPRHLNHSYKHNLVLAQHTLLDDFLNPVTPHHPP
jgi:hypothetical protein